MNILIIAIHFAYYIVLLCSEFQFGSSICSFYLLPFELDLKGHIMYTIWLCLFLKKLKKKRKIVKKISHAFLVL